MESPFKCPVCKNTYSQLNVPVLNPNCGHSLCRNCASTRCGDCAECPIDKKPFPGRGINALPRNLALLKAAEERNAERRRRVRTELERNGNGRALETYWLPPEREFSRTRRNPNVVEIGAREPSRRAPRCARCNLRPAEPTRDRRPAREDRRVYDVYHHFPAGHGPN